MKKGMIYVDIKKCLACKSCEMACAVQHSESKNLFEAILEGRPLESRVTVEPLGEYAVPLQCRHCENAPCVAICPTHALEKTEVEGPVLIKDELCIGCKACTIVCPFGVIRMSRDGLVMIKCDLCVERLKEGQMPACVESCPTGAIQFKSTEQIAGEARKRAKEEFLVAFEKSEKVKVS